MDRLIDIIKEFTPSEIIKIEEKDRQFKALKRLNAKIEDKTLFLKLIVINALLSYQLQTKGEKYWENFSLHFSETPYIEAFYPFLKKYNKRLFSRKIERFQKSLHCLRRWRGDYYCKNLTLFVKEMARCMGQKEDAKTIVFSAKMLLYGCRIVLKENILAPQGIFIPLDNRIKKISNRKEFWKKVEEETGIPLLHIDSILWVTMGIDEREIEEFPLPLREKLKKLKEFLYAII